MAESSSSLKSGLLNIKDYSDLILKCDGEEFKVHRAIVCAKSPVIATALTGDYMEAKTGVLNVSFDIESVRRLVEFMYTGDYQISHNPASELLSSDAPARKPEDHSNDVEIIDEDVDNTAGQDPSESVYDRLVCHSRMNSIADYYDIPVLATLSTSKAREALSQESSVEPFFYLLQQSLGSTNDRNFLRMLGKEAVNHVYELFERHVFDEGGLAEVLAPYALPECILRMKAAEAHEKELKSSLLFETEAREREARDSARSLQNVKECVQLLEENDLCRNPRCDAEFKCYFEQKGPSYEPFYILRCARCRCRHQ